MNTERMIQELKYVIKKHENDKLSTFQTDIAGMCRDILPKIELLKEYEDIGTVEDCRSAMNQKIISEMQSTIVSQSKKFQYNFDENMDMCDEKAKEYLENIPGVVSADVHYDTSTYSIIGVVNLDVSRGETISAFNRDIACFSTVPSSEGSSETAE